MNPEKWDALVDRTPRSAFFSYSWYLDELAENWCVLVNDDYSQGVALPFTVRLGQRILYTPIFVSYLEWLGENLPDESIRSIILKEFKIVETAFLQPILGAENEEFICQWLWSDVPVKLGSQAKRMLKKAEKNELDVNKSNEFSSIFVIVEKELQGKFVGVAEDHFQDLKRSILAAKSRGVVVSFEVREKGNCVGGVICFEKEDQLLYLKGAVTENAKKSGGMYLAINAAIEYAKSKQKDVDFGGSRVEGVRRFNKNFGGEDVIYYAYQINHGPFWFNWVRSLRKRLLKK